MSKFKLQGLGLDLRNLDIEISPVFIEKIEPEDSDLRIDYALIDLFDPSPHRANDVLQYVIVNGGIPIVYIDCRKLDTEEIDPFSQSYELFKILKNSYWGFPGNVTILFSHLPNPGKNKTWEGIDKWKSDPIISYFGLAIEEPSEGDWLEEINLWERLWEEKPKVIARSISPLCYSVELEEWIKLAQPITIGLDVLGGKFGQPALEGIFGIPYLLAFASFNSQSVLLSNPGVDTRRYIEWMRNLVGKELEGKQGEKFVVTKSVNKIPKSPKKLIYESFKFPLLTEEWIIPISSSDILYQFSDTVFNFIAPQTKLSSIPGYDEDWNLSGIEFDAKEKLFQYVSTKVKSPEVSWKLGLLAISDLLSNEFKTSDRWTLGFCTLGKYVLAINASRVKKKTWVKKYLPDELETQRGFLLVMKDPGNFFFIDIESLENNNSKIEENGDEENS